MHGPGCSAAVPQKVAREPNLRCCGGGAENQVEQRRLHVRPQLLKNSAKPPVHWRAEQVVSKFGLAAGEEIRIQQAGSSKERVSVREHHRRLSQASKLCSRLPKQVHSAAIEVTGQ